MVHTSTVAFAVLALKAASVLAAPTEYTSELAQREFDRDLDAREFDFEDMVERELFEFDEEIIARATTTSTTSATATSTATGANPTVTKATTTTTTHVAKPTGKNKKETKTVVITVLQPATKCKKLNAIQRLALKVKAMRKHSQIKAAARKARRQARKEAIRNKRAGAKGAATTTTTSATSTSTSSKTTTTAAPTGTAASKTATANWTAITPPPNKSLAKGVILKESKKKGKDGHTTIRRTVTAAPTACAVSSAKKSPHREYKQRSRRDLEDMEDLLEREYYFDELD